MVYSSAKWGNFFTIMVKNRATKVIIPGNIGFVNYISAAIVKILGTVRVR